MIKKMEKHRFSEMKIESPDSHTARNKGNICFAGSIAYLSLESKGVQDKMCSVFADLHLPRDIGRSGRVKKKDAAEGDSLSHPCSILFIIRKRQIFLRIS